MHVMEAVFTAIVGYIEFGLNVAAIFVITFGGAQAFYGTLRVVFTRGVLSEKRLVWTDFARWLVLALEFELAADLLRTIVAPTWADLGQLAAIAAIRTFLNYFLEKDIEAAPPSSVGNAVKS
jgi:uncharacterized membrane protein